MPIFAFQALPVQTPAHIARDDNIHSPAANCLYRTSISVYPTLTNLDTLPLVDTIPMMHLHEGKQNNADVQFFKTRRKTNDSYRRFDEDCIHAQKTLFKSYATLYIAHLDKNKGKCRQGFMQELVE